MASQETFPDSISRPFAALIALTICLGVFLRFWALDEKLAWHDEVATRILAAGYLHDEWKAALYTGGVIDVADVQRYQHHNPERSVVKTITGLAQDDPQHPPLYYVLARLWISGLGDGIGTLRALSALLSLLCFPGIYWLCKELFRSSRIAWTAVALVAASPLFVLYAQEAREYALWTALILLSNAALLRAIRWTEESPAWALRPARAWATYGLFTLLGLYTSFSTSSLIAAQIAFLLIRERGRLTRVAKASASTLAVTALLFLPWAVNLLRNYQAFNISMKWSREIVIPRLSLLRILGMNASRMTLDFWRELDCPLAWLAMGLTLISLVWALAFAIRRAPRTSGLLIGASIVLPLGMLLLPDLVFGGIRSVSARYLMPSWIAIEVALAFLLVGEDRPPPARRLSWAALVAVLAIGMGSSFSNAQQTAVWTKGISYELPAVAKAINGSARPLVVGNMELYNPGNLMALSNLLPPRARMQFLKPEMEEGYILPRDAGDVFLMSPTIQFRRGLEARERLRTRLVLEDIYLQLWAVDREL
jgi:uncharacterized membrane protein